MVDVPVPVVVVVPVVVFVELVFGVDVDELAPGSGTDDSTRNPLGAVLHW
jgi:hypothetical protein